MTDDELRKLLNDARPGPWVAYCEGCGCDYVLDKDGRYVTDYPMSEATGRVMALAPDLAAEVLRLRNENRQLRMELANAINTYRVPGAQP